MTKTTKIQWTDYTVNFWEGCQKVGPGCDNCYAEARDVRFTGGSHWGAGAPRRWVKGGIPKLLKINRNAEAFKSENGRWPNVFCSSLSDVFDNAVPVGYRLAAFPEIEAASNCHIQLLTKRIGNVEKMVPYDWSHNRNDGWPSHIGLMITVVNQAEADRDIPKLLDLKERLGIPWVGLSVEPMLGPIDLGVTDPKIACSQHCKNGCSGPASAECAKHYSSLDWVICGGESGPNSRPMHPDWARSLRDQCVDGGVPFFFKQWGAWKPIEHQEMDRHWPKDKASAICLLPDGSFHVEGRRMQRIGAKAAGNLLDGRVWEQVPEATP